MDQKVDNNSKTFYNQRRPIIEQSSSRDNCIILNLSKTRVYHYCPCRVVTFSPKKNCVCVKLAKLICKHETFG